MKHVIFKLRTKYYSPYLVHERDALCCFVLFLLYKFPTHFFPQPYKFFHDWIVYASAPEQVIYDDVYPLSKIGTAITLAHKPVGPIWQHQEIMFSIDKDIFFALIDTWLTLLKQEPAFILITQNKEGVPSITPYQPTDTPVDGRHILLTKLELPHYSYEASSLDNVRALGDFLTEDYDWRTSLTSPAARAQWLASLPIQQPIVGTAVTLYKHEETITITSHLWPDQPCTLSHHALQAIMDAWPSAHHIVEKSYPRFILLALDHHNAFHVQASI